jgi:carbon monoxide dehydrogenase subunit G
LQFEKEVEILAPREKVWNFIWDVDRFIACVPGCKEAKTIEAGKLYSATMIEKVGPFRVEFPTTIEVLEREELTRIKAQASGADNKIGSRMKLSLDVKLREQGEKTVPGRAGERKGGIRAARTVWRSGQGVCRRNGAAVGDEGGLDSLRTVDQRQKCEGS